MDKASLIEALIQIEYDMFDATEGLDGRAGCQDDRRTFHLMRRCQHQIWSEEVLRLVLSEFAAAKAEGRNLIAEKYGYMMAESDPAYYEAHLKDRLPSISPVKAQALSDLEAIFRGFYEALLAVAPSVARHGRVQETTRYEVSAATYLAGELKTWSLKAIYQALEEMQAAAKSGRNPVAEIVACQSAGPQPQDESLEASRHGT